MAKNVRFSKKEGQSAKFVIVSQKSRNNDGQKSQKIQNVGSNYQKNTQKYPTMESFKLHQIIIFESK